MSRRRMLATWTFIPAFAGTICLMVAMRSPRFVDFHSMDVLQLLVPGMCYGVALTGLVRLVGKAPKG